MILLSVSYASPWEESLLLDLPDRVVFGDGSFLRDDLDCCFLKKAMVGPVSDKSHSSSKLLSNVAELFITEGTPFPPFFADILLLTA